MGFDWGFVKRHSWWVVVLVMATLAYSLFSWLFAEPETLAITVWTTQTPDQVSLVTAAATTLTEVSAQSTSVATHHAPSLPNNTQIGVYNGPGAVGALGNFAGWLSRPVPYAADYIDYKGGWQKDFVDSK